MNVTATIHDTISAKPTTQKMLPAYSPALEFGEPYRHQPNDRHQCPRQHRRGRGSPRKGRGLGALPAFLHFHHHHFDGDNGIVHEQAEREVTRRA